MLGPVGKMAVVVVVGVVGCATIPNAALATVWSRYLLLNPLAGGKVDTDGRIDSGLFATPNGGKGGVGFTAVPGRGAGP